MPKFHDDDNYPCQAAVIMYNHLTGQIEPVDERHAQLALLTMDEVEYRETVEFIKIMNFNGVMPAVCIRLKDNDIEFLVGVLHQGDTDA